MTPRSRLRAASRRKPMANPFVHVELNTNDPDKAKAFYSRLFDWKLEDAPMPGGGSYTLIDVGEGTGGGMMKNPVPGVPSNWLAYVGVDDVASTTRKAKELGGKVLMEKKEIGDFGIMSVIADPTGAVFALWQSKKPQGSQKK
jgi:predicted enzyme related to lactoylglutathione lyase